MTDSEWTAVVDNESLSAWILVDVMEALGLRTHGEVHDWIEDRLQMRIEQAAQDLEQFRVRRGWRRQASEASAS